MFWFGLYGDAQGQGQVEGLGRAKTSQPLKLAPPQHDGRSSATYELPQKIFACWRFSHSRAGTAIEMNTIHSIAATKSFRDHAELNAARQR